MSGGGSFLGGFQFALSDLPNYADFALYDQYRILRVDIHISSGQNRSEATTTTLYPMPILLTCIDYDDANTPTYNQVMQHESCVVHGILAGMKHVSLVPRASKALYQGAFSGYGQEIAPWINIGSPSVQHFGFKYAIIEAPAFVNSNTFFHCVITWNLSTRSSLILSRHYWCGEL
jgi:hypothetical protein